MRLLLVEAYLFLGWARILKSLKFSKVAPLLGEQMIETSFTDRSNEKILHEITRAINIMSRHTLWDSLCLVKAMAAMKMLERRNIDSTLYLGTTKSEDGSLIAHAWLRSGPFYITGFEEMEQYTIISKFSKNMSEQTLQGDSNE